MLGRFAASILVCIFAACGAQVDDGGTSGSLNVGGTASSAGGSTSISIGASGGSTSASNGGSSTTYPVEICNGMFADASGCSTEQLTNVTSCDIPLQQSPPDIVQVRVAIDCNLIQEVAPDAGVPGFYVDYSYSPAHLELTGSICTNVSMNGAQSLVVIVRCHGFF